MTIELLQEYNLSESSLSVGGVLESVEVFLQGNDLLGSLVNGFPDNTVSTFTQLLKNFIFLQNVSFDFFSHISNLLNSNNFFNFSNF